MRLTPDGARYLAMAQGERQPMPFHVRPLIPMLCGESELRWIVTTVCSVVAATLLTGALALQHGATHAQAGAAMGLLAGLPWVRFCLRAPVLVDMPGLAFALGAAVLWPVHLYAAVAVLVVGSLASEKVPVWAAVFAWTPLPLVALVIPALVRLLYQPGEVRSDDPHRETLTHPLATGLKFHAGHWRNPLRMLTPWGAALAALWMPSAWLGAAVAVGYAQLLVATDTVRLYQAAAPVVCVVAAMTIPTAWLLPLMVAHWCNPFAGEGA